MTWQQVESRIGRIGEIMLDSDGYPTEDTLNAICSYDLVAHSLDGLLKLVQENWYYPDRFDRYSRGKKLYLSTGGWGGNEEVVDALQRNLIFWPLYWWKSQRGGHYWFEFRN